MSCKLWVCENNTKMFIHLFSLMGKSKVGLATSRNTRLKERKMHMSLVSIGANRVRQKHSWKYVHFANQFISYFNRIQIRLDNSHLKLSFMWLSCESDCSFKWQACAQDTCLHGSRVSKKKTPEINVTWFGVEDTENVTCCAFQKTLALSGRLATARQVQKFISSLRKPFQFYN